MFSGGTGIPPVQGTIEVENSGIDRPRSLQPSLHGRDDRATGKH
jgi:hypothetical protein